MVIMIMKYRTSVLNGSTWISICMNIIITSDEIELVFVGTYINKMWEI